MAKIYDFFKSHKYPIIWTIGYIFAMWAILQGMFNFNIFSHAHWTRLMHAQLHGFAGFVFGILILAALPLYIATTLVIVRTGSPLFTIPCPKIISKIISVMTATPDDTDTSTATEPTAMPDATTPQEAADKPSALPHTRRADVPAELHAAFVRARDRIPYAQNASAQYPRPGNHDATTRDTDEIPTADIDAFPLPADFDINTNTTGATDSSDFFGAPTFTEINFDAPQSAANPTAQPMENIPPELAPVAEYLNNIGTEFRVDGDVILTQTSAIASHIDQDFWVADNDTWFATGKSRPSPVAAALAAASTHGLHPVLYLGANNIMDIDAKIAQWESDGVHVISDLSNLTE